MTGEVRKRTISIILTLMLIVASVSGMVFADVEEQDALIDTGIAIDDAEAQEELIEEPQEEPEELIAETSEALPLADLMPLASGPNNIDLTDTSIASATGWTFTAPNTYDITGNVTIEGSVSSGIILNISAGATVTTTGDFSIQGSSASAMLTLSGGGAFIGNTGTISNTGAGSAISVTGAGQNVTFDGITVSNTGTGSAISITSTATGATVTLNNGTSVSSGSNGNGVLINANTATVNVNSGSIVESLGNNVNAAIQIGSGSTSVVKAVVSINGGAVISTGSGYAINDSLGAGTANTNIDTKISIVNGMVTAGSNSAIYSTTTQTSTSPGAIVFVDGGIVSNAAGNNLNPAININTAPGRATDAPGVIIDGGTVASTSNAGYAIQSTGNILVKSGTVTAINGRAINLVGTNSNVNITGGLVQATGSGTAISSATTNPLTVTVASVSVSGGTISANSGNAIQVTGLTSSIMIVGGTITSDSGNAINATSDAANAKIAVNGDAIVSSVSGNAINAATNTARTTNQTVYVGGTTKVSSVSGHAIQTNGRGSSVEVVENAQVWILKEGYAILSSGTVEINGGFIFAYGSGVTRGSPPYASANANGVISAGSPSPFTIDPSVNALVVAWNPVAGRTVYPIGSTTTDDLDLGNSYVGDPTDYWWAASSSMGSGIRYSMGGAGGLAGFFPLAEVTVTRDFGLIFDAATGALYQNTDNNPPAPGQGTLWSSTPVSGYHNLNLNGFSWATSVPAALTIINGPTTINLTGENFFESTYQLGGSAGIVAQQPEVTSLTIQEGISSGALTAIGVDYGITGQTINYIDGTLTAQGNTAAMSITTFSNNNHVYTYWTNTEAVDPGGSGTSYIEDVSPHENPYTYVPGADLFVRLIAGPGAIISDVRVSGNKNIGLEFPVFTSTIYLFNVHPDKSTIMLGFINSWFELVPNGINILATWNETENSIELEFSGIPRQALTEIFHIAIPASIIGTTEDLVVIINPYAWFLIYGDDDDEMDAEDASLRRSAHGGPTDSPETGDSRNIEGWTTTMLISALGLLSILLWIRLRKPFIAYKR